MSENLYEAGIVITADTVDAENSLVSVVGAIEAYESKIKEIEAFKGKGSPGIDGGGEKSKSEGSQEESFIVGGVGDDVIAAIEAILGITGNLKEESEQLTETLDGAGDAGADAMSRTEEEAKELDKELKEKEKDVDEVAEAFKLLGEAGSESFKQIGSNLFSLVRGFVSLGDSLAGLVDGGFFQLSQQAARLHGRLGDSDDAMQEFKSSVLEVAEETQIVPSIMGDLAYNLRTAGLEFSSTTEEQKKAAITMGKMVGVLGVSVEEVTKFAASSRMMGASITDLVNRASDFEKQFKIPELVEELPGITQQAIKVQAQFGRSTVKDAKKASVAVTRMAAVYARSLGKTAAEAAQDARESLAAFAGETRSFRDVFIGLADGFSPLQTAFLEVGYGVDDLGRLMEKAQTDQAGFVEEVNRIRNALDPQMSERFFQQVLRNSPEAVRMLLTQEEAYARMTKAQREAHKERQEQQKEAARRQAAFQDMVTDMRDNVVDLYSRFTSLWDVFLTTAAIDLTEEGIAEGMRTLIGYAQQLGETFKDFRSFFQGNDEALQDYGNVVIFVAGAIRDLFNPIEEGEERTNRFSKILGVVTASSLGLGTALGVVSSIFLTLGGVIKPMWSMFATLVGFIKKADKAILKAGKGASRFKGAIKILGKVIGKLVVPIGAVIAAFEGFEDKIGTIGKAIENEDWDKAMDTVLSGVWDSVDSFFLGLPNKFVEGFNSVGQAVNTEGAENMGKSVGDMLGKVIVVITDWVTTDLPNWVSNSFIPAVKDWWSWEKIKKEAIQPFLRGLAGMGHQIIAFFKGTAEGILNAFGVPFDGLGHIAYIAFLKVKKFFYGGWLELGDLLMMVWSDLKIAFWEAMVSILVTTEEILGKIERGVLMMVSTSLHGIAKLAQAALDNAALLGITSETATKAVDKIRSAQNKLTDSMRKSREEELRKIKMLKKGRGIIIDDIEAEQKAREDKTKAAKKAIEEEIKLHQKLLNKKAEERATEGIATTGIQEPKKKSPVEANTEADRAKIAEDEVETKARQKLAVEAREVKLAEAVTTEAKNLGMTAEQWSQVRDLLIAAKGMETAATGGAGGMAAAMRTGAAQQRAVAKDLIVRFRPGARDLFQRALEQMEMEAVDRENVRR